MELDQLGDARQLKAWLDAGETVELREQDRVVARIVPEQAERETTPQKKPAQRPDFLARARQIFGDRVLPGSDLLIEEREKERY